MPFLNKVNVIPKTVFPDTILGICYVFPVIHIISLFHSQRQETLDLPYLTLLCDNLKNRMFSKTFFPDPILGIFTRERSSKGLLFTLLFFLLLQEEEQQQQQSKK
jgi:hypothetical protein